MIPVYHSPIKDVMGKIDINTYHAQAACEARNTRKSSEFFPTVSAPLPEDCNFIDNAFPAKLHKVPPIA